MKTDLTKAAQDLEAKLAKSVETEEVEEDTSASKLLSKALDALRNLTKSAVAEEKPAEEPEDEETEDEETEETADPRAEVAKSEARGQETFYKGMVNSPVGNDLEGLVDSTPVLEAALDELAKSAGRVEAIYDSLASQDTRITAIVDGQMALVKGMAQVIEYFDKMSKQPAGRTNPGVIVMPTGNSEARGDIPANLKEMVTKAVQKGDLEPKYLQWFDTRSESEIFAALPPNVLD